MQTAPSFNQKTKFHRIAAALLGVLVSIICAFSVRVAIKEEYRSRISSITDDLKSRVQTRLARYETALTQARAFLIVEGAIVTKQKFYKYASEIALFEHYPGAQGIGFATVVNKKSIAANATFSHLGETFTLWPTDPPREHYSSIVYLYPENWRNRRAIGFDMYSEPTRKLAMDHAMETGQPAMTAQIKLVQETGKESQPGFLLYEPVYKPGAGVESVEQRKAALIGFLTAPFRAYDFIQAILPTSLKDVDFQIYAGAHDMNQLLYDHHASTAESSDLEATADFDFAGQKIFLSVQAEKSFYNRAWDFLPVAILLVGLGISGLFYKLLSRTSREGAAEREKALLLETSLDAVVGADESNKVIYWNRNAEQVFGWPKDEALGSEMNALIIPERLREAHNAGMKRFIKTGVAHIQNKRIEISALRRSGEEFSVELTVTSIKGAGGYRFYSFIRDITERKTAEQRIAQSEQEFRNLADSMPQIAWTANPDGEIDYYNQRWFEYTGLDYEQTKGWGWGPVLHPDDVKKCINIWTESVKTGDPYQIEYRFKRAMDGEYRWHLGKALPSRNQAGKITKWFGTCTDIDDQKTATEELRRAKEEAERANHLKSAFLANMSHEIRTPLGAMLGFADLLRDRELTSDEKANYIDVLTRNGESLSVIINDILDLSKVEAGHLVLELTEIYPSKIAAEVVLLFQVKANEKKLALELSIDPKAPEKIVADSVRTKQILVNLVGNAIKFTSTGSVKIHITACKTASNRGAVCFEVSDTGIGIPEAQTENVFQMFVQADGSMTRRFGGTGLGLALSRSLARQLGGDVTIARTQEGSGTTFVAVVEDQPADRISSSKMSGPT